MVPTVDPVIKRGTELTMAWDEKLMLFVFAHLEEVMRDCVDAIHHDPVGRQLPNSLVDSTVALRERANRQTPIGITFCFLDGFGPADSECRAVHDNSDHVVILLLITMKWFPSLLLYIYIRNGTTMKSLRHSLLGVILLAFV